jgi:hypothetical protein
MYYIVAFGYVFERASKEEQEVLAYHFRVLATTFSEE